MSQNSDFPFPSSDFVFPPLTFKALSSMDDGPREEASGGKKVPSPSTLACVLSVYFSPFLCFFLLRPSTLSFLSPPSCPFYLTFFFLFVRHPRSYVIPCFSSSLSSSTLLHSPSHSMLLSPLTSPFILPLAYPYSPFPIHAPPSPFLPF